MKNIKSKLYSLFLFVGVASASAQMSAPVFDVNGFGAVGDSSTNNTAAIQAAINSCAGTGGTVYLHDGKFLSGMLTLKSEMTFYIAPTATLVGVTDTAQYPTQILPTNNWNKQENGRGFLYSLGARNLKITGGGTINGNGRYRQWGFEYGVINPDELERPIPIWIVQSVNVEISNINVVDGAMWTIVPFETDSLVIRNVNINSNIVANRDGIDLVDCHHVLIEDCVFFTDDDAICPKSGHARGVQDVVVRRCIINKSGRASAIKFGTLGYGSFKNMLFEDIEINDVNLAAIALEAVDGADIDSVTFRRIKMNNVGAPFFIVLGDRGRTPDGAPHKIGSVKNVVFQDITATGLKTNLGCPITGFTKNGTTYKLQNILFENIDVTFNGGSTTIPANPAEYAGQYPEVNMWGNTPAFGYYVRHADSVVFKNCTSRVNSIDAREWLVTNDISKLTIENSSFAVIENENLANAKTHTANSGFNNINLLWDNATAQAANDAKATGNVEAWVEYDFNDSCNIVLAKLFEDNAGNQVTNWKLTKWTGVEWVDVFPYTESNSSGWQTVNVNLVAKKVRLYAKCNIAGSITSIHEFQVMGAPVQSRSVEAFLNCGENGEGIKLGFGKFHLSDLEFKGLTDNSISALKVDSGYIVELFDNDHFTGNTISVEGTQTCLSEKDFDNKTSSLIIRHLTPEENADRFTSKIAVQPSPKDNLLYITGLESSCMFEVSDQLGQVLISNKVVKSNPTVDVSALEVGVYNLKVMCGNRIESFKFIKQ